MRLLKRYQRPSNISLQPTAADLRAPDESFAAVAEQQARVELDRPRRGV